MCIRLMFRPGPSAIIISLFSNSTNSLRAAESQKIVQLRPHKAFGGNASMGNTCNSSPNLIHLRSKMFRELLCHEASNVFRLRLLGTAGPAAC